MPRTITADSEESLVDRSQQGDRSAFGELVRRHHRPVVSIVYRMCGDAEISEDAAQEAFLQAWLKLDTFHPEPSLRSWLYRIAINAALDVLRGRESRAPSLEAVATVDPSAGPESALLQKEQEQTVQQAILLLNPPLRTVLILREYGELSYREISSALDIPVGTVMSRLSSARSRLRERLQIDWENDHE